MKPDFYQILNEANEKMFARKGVNGLLDQIIEECSELTKAIIKKRRAQGEGQPTDITVPEAQDQIIEEIADLKLCIDQYIDILECSNPYKDIRQRIRHIQEEKMIRTAKRFTAEEIGEDDDTF